MCKFDLFYLSQTNFISSPTLCKNELKIEKESRIVFTVQNWCLDIKTDSLLLAKQSVDFMIQQRKKFVNCAEQFKPQMVDSVSGYLL